MRATHRREPAPHRDLPEENREKQKAAMTVSLSATAPLPNRAARSHRARSHVASVVQLLTLIALTGLVTGLIVAITFVGVLDQLTTASH